MNAVADLVGKPFAWGGRGPERWDCWGLVLEAARRMGVVIDRDWRIADGDFMAVVRRVEAETAEGPWRRVAFDRAEPGDVCVMTLHRRVHHVGILVDGGVLHTTAATGAIVQTPAALRLSGYHRVEAYRWAG